MSTMTRQRAAVALLMLSMALPGCDGEAVVVGADPLDLISSARFVAWEDLPVQAQQVRPPVVGGSTEYLGAATILPGSEPRRLLIGVWHNSCNPLVTIAAPSSMPRLDVAIGAGSGACGDVVKMWPIEVLFTRDVDPAAVVLVITDERR